MHELDTAWVAGLFEGEGCFRVKDKRTASIALCVTMTDKDVVDRLHAIVGIGSVIYLPRRKTMRKDAWCWEASGKPAIELARKLEPWLGMRRRKRLHELLAARRLVEDWVTRPRTCDECGQTFRPTYSAKAHVQRFCNKTCRHGHTNARRPKRLATT